MSTACSGSQVKRNLRQLGLREDCAQELILELRPLDRKGEWGAEKTAQRERQSSRKWRESSWHDKMESDTPGAKGLSPCMVLGGLGVRR